MTRMRTTGFQGNTLDITADGAHVSDPGCNCDTPVNPNADMIAEFKVTMSNFSAENQKGPGGDQFRRQIGRPELSRFGVLLRPELRSERQRLAVELQQAAAPAEQVLLPGRHLRRTGDHPRHSHQQEPAEALLLHRL